MKEVHEVTLTYTALVLADDSEQAEEIARQEQGEITSDDNHPKIECGVSFRSRKELADYAELEQSRWSADCLPYGLEGDENGQALGQILDRIEDADAITAEALAGRCPDTVDIFEEPKPVAPAEPESPPDFRLMLARKFAGGGPDWCWCSMEFVGSGEGAAALIEGGVPNLGPDGQRRWTGVRTGRVVVTDSQIAAAALAWEQETGKCSMCAGSGQWCSGWSSTEGNQYLPCARCAAIGRALKS